MNYPGCVARKSALLPGSNKLSSSNLIWPSLFESCLFRLNSQDNVKLLGVDQNNH